MELVTKEYLDQSLEKLIERFDTRLDEKLDEKLDSKLAEQTRELKAYVHESFEAQQIWIDERFAELLDNHHLQHQVQKIQLAMTKVAAKMGIDYKPE